MAMNLATAAIIADGTLAAGRRENCEPLAVVVLDAGGHDVVVKRAARALIEHHTALSLVNGMAEREGFEPSRRY